VKTLLRVSIGAFALYAVLYWAVNNPKSMANIKISIDETASNFVDSLTDEE